MTLSSGDALAQPDEAEREREEKHSESDEREIHVRTFRSRAKRTPRRIKTAPRWARHPLTQPTCRIATSSSGGRMNGAPVHGLRACDAIAVHSNGRNRMARRSHSSAPRLAPKAEAAL